MCAGHDPMAVGVLCRFVWAGVARAARLAGRSSARLLREYAPQIGIDPAFTIHDREDSADLMNLVRHELGLSKTESRFPTKAACLAIYSRAVNAGERFRSASPVRQYGPQCPAPKQLVERTSLLIGDATDNRTTAEALVARMRLLHQQLRSSPGVK